MQTAPLPLTRDLVLIGGGHSHALLLRRWLMDPLPGARLTLVNPGPTAPYSGMLPGFVAGHYDRAALDIDLVGLARAAGARLILGAATGIDRARREIAVTGHPPVGYDIASIDVGITSEMTDLPGFAEHAVPAKPLGPFAAAWARFRAREGDAGVAVIGGGVAGAELAMAMAHALRARDRRARVHLVDRGRVLGGLRAPAARRLRRALRAQEVELHENAQIDRVEATGLVLADGTRLAAEFVTGAAGARPHGWLARTGLEVTQGFVTVDAHLQSSDPAIFAVGDCAHLAFDPRPKAGVYAVRQAPVLAANLRAALGCGRMRRYRPQKDYLKLISLGGKLALGDRFGLAFSGPWVWRWKDRIDRGFMDRFRDLPKMPPPDLPRCRARDLAETVGARPLCGGCGAKLGRDALGAALESLPPPRREDVTPLPGDDAALLRTGGARQVLTTDHLRSLWPDPAVMARIAALHALGDVWAMGADPQAATLSVTLPRLSDRLARRTMVEILAEASRAMRDAGAEIVGGHSTLGDELTIGFAVTGLCETTPITLAGAAPGDLLILTKPIGSGVVMAAEMAGEAEGDWVAAALAAMMREQGSAARLLRGRARAMTDVTGFGLAGHVQNICLASGTGAELALDAVPLLPGAEALAARGVTSSLFASNRRGFDLVPQGARADLLFDPQTGGGLLAAVPEECAPALVAALHAAGHAQSAVIGRLTDPPVGQVVLTAPDAARRSPGD